MTAIESPTNNFKGPMTPTGGPGGNGVYIVGLGGDASMIHGAQFVWDAAFVGSVTIWSSNLPLQDAPLTYTGTGGPWVQQNPPSGYTAVSPAGAATTPTPLVLNIPGGTAGGADMTWGNGAAKRFVARVTCTTAGQFTARAHGKE